MPEIKTIFFDRLTEEEALAISRLTAATWPKEGRTPEGNAKNFMQQKGKHNEPPLLRSRFFTIWEGDRVIANARIFPRIIRTPDGEVMAMALASVCAEKQLRGTGLGKQVVRAAFDLVDDGIFPLSIYQTTPDVRPFYEKLGAREIHNKIINSKAEDPTANPFWDPVAMIYPASYEMPDGTIDLLGEGF
ncbi:MAG: GNAT family N-acetyltransferase [Candidatus Sumerlaeia bacterium]